MKIIFQSSSYHFYYGGEQYAHHNVNYWAGILQKLRSEMPATCTDFNKWLEEEWKITQINSDQMNGIEGVEIDDHSFTMLVLRFPSIRQIR